MTDEAEICAEPHPKMERRCVKPEGHDGDHVAGWAAW